MSRAIDGDKLFEFIQKEKAWKQFTIKRPRYDKGKQDAYYEMLEIIQEQPTIQPESWIPVSERLPKALAYVLVTIKYKDNSLGVRRAARVANCTFKWLLDDSKAEVIAWQPLPEPYKEDK